MRDAILRTYTRPAITTYADIRCGRCAETFTTCGNFKTARCPFCGRVCRLDTAERAAEVLPPNVVSMFRRTA